MTHTHAHEHHIEETYSKTVFGFWIYLLTDFMMFATLFATYAVLQGSTYGGPSIKDLQNLPVLLAETILLLLASFASGLGGIYAHREQRRKVIALFSLTFVLGAAFLSVEWIELQRLLSLGHHWSKSAFLSAFFTLIVTHTLHILIALLWTILLLLPVLLRGLGPVDIRRLTCLKMFWQFVNVIWIFIYTIVYLMGGSHA